MKKSLVMVTVLVALVAFAAVALAGAPAPACPAGPAKCEYGVKYKPVKPVPAVLPAPTKPKPGKCVTVPCPPQQVFVPGPPFAMYDFPTQVPKMVEKDVLRLLCAGKAKGVCPIGCPPCVDKVKWAVEWSTMEQCGKVAVKTMVPGTVSKPIAVTQKMVPVKPVCQ